MWTNATLGKMLMENRDSGYYLANASQSRLTIQHVEQLVKLRLFHIG